MDDRQVREGLPTIPAQRCRLILNNWARWLVLDRIGFHVVISFFDSLQKVAWFDVRADRLFSIPTGSESLLPATGPDGHLGNEASGECRELTPGPKLRYLPFEVQSNPQNGNPARDSKIYA